MSYIYYHISSHLIININEDKLTSEMERMVNIDGEQRKEVKINDSDEEESEEEESVDIERYYPLCTAIHQNDWEAVENFIRKNPEALTARISSNMETVLQKVVYFGGPIWLVKKLASQVNDISPEMLEQTDCSGDTALSDACQYGNTKAAEILVTLNKDLLKMRNHNNLYPIQRAAFFGRKETIKYLLSVTEVGEDQIPFAGQNGVRLLQNLIRSNLYGIALGLLKQYPNLARDKNANRSSILQILASKPRGFESGCRLGYWQRFIYQSIPVQEEHISFPQTKKNDLPYHHQNVDGGTYLNVFRRGKNWSRKSTPTAFGALRKILHIMLWNALKQFAPSIKRIHDTKLMHKQTIEIVRMMCARDIWTSEDVEVTLKNPLLTAAKLGISELVNEIIKAYFFAASMKNEDGHRIHDLAVLHRREKVFSLIYQVPGLRQFMTKCSYFPDNHGENILHLAGKFAPSHEVPGAALQMQRELQWFKAVENIVHPSLQERQNNANKTPREVFTEEHADLVKDGGKWMKANASWCTLVAALIITVVFAAAYTVPGGTNTDGIPNFLHKPSFIVFVISDALALFSSITSLLMFLGVLASRYAEDDFLESLPRKFVIGMIAMFFSIASMMVAFGATIYIVLSPLWKLTIVPIALLGCLPVTLFARLQFPLFVEIYSSTYRPSIYQKIKYKDM